MLCRVVPHLSLMQIIFYFWSFHIKECILRIRIDSCSRQIYNIRVMFRPISVFGLNSIYSVIINTIVTYIQCHVRQDLTVSIKLIFKSSPVVQC